MSNLEKVDVNIPVPILTTLKKFLANPILYFGSKQSCEEYFKLLSQADLLLEKVQKK